MSKLGRWQYWALSTCLACAKHFAFVMSLNSYNSPAPSIITLILNVRDWCTELRHLPRSHSQHHVLGQVFLTQTPHSSPLYNAASLASKCCLHFPHQPASSASKGMKDSLLSTFHTHSPTETIQCNTGLVLSWQDDRQWIPQNSGKVLGENLSKVYLYTCPKIALATKPDLSFSTLTSSEPHSCRGLTI